MENWSWPQWVMISLWIIAILAVAKNQGRPKPLDFQKHDLTHTAFRIGWMWILLYFGGFFS